MRPSLIVIALVLWVVPLFAQAYQCRYEPAPEEALRDADAVFTGTVQAVVKQKPIPKTKGGLGTSIVGVTFAVDKVWKGLTPNDYKVPVLVEAFYGYDFKIGTEYLVYAYRIFTPDTTLSIVGCPRVRPVSEAGKALHQLGLPALNVVRKRATPVAEPRPAIQEVTVHEPPVSEEKPIMEPESNPTYPGPSESMPSPEADLFEPAPSVEPAL